MPNLGADRAIRRFRQLYEREPAVVVRAPGRVNLLGGHVDFQECWVLASALEQSVWLAAGPRDRYSAGFVSIHSEELRETSGFSLEGLAPGGLRGWIGYPAGVAWALAERGLPVEGLEAVVASDLPIGAGLSSSAALEVAFALAWQTIGGWNLDTQRLAEVCRRAENGFVGVECGIQDAFVSLGSRPDQILLLDCRTLRWGAIPLPPQATLVVIDTGIRRQLASSEYNARRAQVEQGLAAIQRLLLGIDTLRDVPPETFLVLEEYLPNPVRARCRHVVMECSRVATSVRDLRRGDVVTFGAAMRASHMSSRDNYGSSVYELDMLAESAWRQPGCYGARLTGAGFGGCIVALMQEKNVPQFMYSINGMYRSAFGYEPSFIVGRPAGGAEAQFYRSSETGSIPLFDPLHTASEVF